AAPRDLHSFPTRRSSDLLVEVLPRIRVEERAVSPERAILDRQWDLERTLGQLTDLAVMWPPAEKVEPGRPGVDVEASHPQGVVVVPHRRGGLLVVVLEGCAARCAGAAMEVWEDRPRRADRPGVHPHVGRVARAR